MPLQWKVCVIYSSSYMIINQAQLNNLLDDSIERLSTWCQLLQSVCELIKLNLHQLTKRFVGRACSEISINCKNMCILRKREIRESVLLPFSLQLVWFYSFRERETEEREVLRNLLGKSAFAPDVLASLHPKILQTTPSVFPHPAAGCAVSSRPRELARPRLANPISRQLT